MNTHTPGPWCVKGGTPLIGIDRPYDIIAGASLIAQTLITPKRSTAAANAALMASAPEMLAALIDLMAIIDSPRISIYGVVDQQWTVTKREARAAIAKANNLCIRGGK